MSVTEALEAQYELLNSMENDASMRVLLGYMAQRRSEVSIATMFKVITTSLADGQTYYWDRDICAMLGESMGGVPNDVRLEESDLPWPAGFFWFATPLDLGDAQGNLKALSWCMHLDHSGRLAPTFTTWIDSRRLPNEGASRFAHLAALPLTVVPWEFGESLDDVYLKGMRSEEAATGSLDYPDRYRLKLSAVAVSLAFIKQTLLVSQTRELPSGRAALRRMPDEYRLKGIDVVRLRRAYATNPHAEASERDWHWRWVVRPHWRRQWYPAQQTHKSILIPSYIKGPENMPLKPKAVQVFSVVR